MKNYYDTKKDWFQEYYRSKREASSPVPCSCGKIVNSLYLSRHQSSDFHKNRLFEKEDHSYHACSLFFHKNK